MSQEDSRGDRLGCHPALPVSDGEPDWESGSPKTAEEYLKRVRWEAAHCEQIARADIDTTQFEEHQTQYIPRVKGVKEAPAFCQPTTAWILQTLQDFQELHEHFEQLNASEDGELPIGVPIMINHSKVSQHAAIVEESLESAKTGIPPDMESVAALDQLEALELASSHMKAFKRIKDARALGETPCFWLYALLSRIHRPLHDTTAAAMRSFFKHCAALRVHYAERWQSASIKERAEMEASKTLAQLNVLYVISGIYFGQDEKMSGLMEMHS